MKMKLRKEPIDGGMEYRVIGEDGSVLVSMVSTVSLNDYYGRKRFAKVLIRSRDQMRKAQNTVCAVGFRSA